MKVRRVDFSPDEWIAGCAMLDNATRGLYITACALIYSHGGAIEIAHLRDACLDHGIALNRQLKILLRLGKLIEKGSRITNKRAENELRNARKRSEKGSKIARERWKNNHIETDHAMQRSTANHQPSTINHQKKESEIQNQAPRATSGPNGKATVAHSDQLLPTPPWQARIASFRKSGFWLPDWGPNPNEPGCFAPRSALATPRS